MLIPLLDGTIRVTSAFGVDRGSYRHGGLDLALLAGSVYRRPVKAPTAGEVVAVWTTDRPSTRDPTVRDGFPYGNAVALRDTEGVLWRFLHFDEPPSLSVRRLSRVRRWGCATRPGTVRVITCTWTRRRTDASIPIRFGWRANG